MEKVRKIYQSGKVRVEALAGIDLEIRPGEYITITGPSGCGKSTLLAILGALDRPTEGKVFIGDIDLTTLDSSGLSEVRSRIGFVFQAFNLFPNLNVQENVELGMSISKVPRSIRKAKAEYVLERVGLQDRLDHQPSELSGGEQQRVAIARALARDPTYLLMDEPTGNLDSKNVNEVLRLIKQLNRQGTTIIMVTHDPAVAHHADKIISIKDGRIDPPKSKVKADYKVALCSRGTSPATP
ncbi:MAG: ABC transporter ATP-binding protein [Methanomassiliicoccus sp.]|nr:ABC transporter ATP-binding protein [Methanomassiliicoccus sp.]